jgi:predicted mannosyl-3-phosphoglycerate phosphatase (HAD superfamily)
MAIAGVSLDEPVRKPSANPPFKILFCDMDGTLLNGRSIITEATADALRAAMAKGVQVIIATGKVLVVKPISLNGQFRITVQTLLTA